MKPKGSMKINMAIKKTDSEKSVLRKKSELPLNTEALSKVGWLAQRPPKKKQTKNESDKTLDKVDIQMERYKRRDELMDYYLPRISLVTSIISLIVVVIQLVL